MRSRSGPTRAALAALFVAAFAMAACGSSASSTTTTTSAPPSTVALPPTATSVADIHAAYDTLFDLSNPALTPKLAVVQDGSQLKAAFAKALDSSLAKQAAGAGVGTVNIEQGSACSSAVLPSPCATVVYSILSPSRSVLLKDAKGAAVYIGGHWLVAKTTICALLTLDNNDQVPSGC